MPDSNLPDNDVLTSAFYDTYIREQVVVTCTSATRPTGVEGRLIFETDTNRLMRYDGSGWVNNTITPWVAYTPGWTNFTLGNGSYTGCQWRYVGTSIEVTGEVELGSTSVVGSDVSQTVPNSETIFVAASTSIGAAQYVEDGVATRTGPITAFASTRVRFLRDLVSGTEVRVATIAATSPFTFGTGDKITWQYSVRLA